MSEFVVAQKSADPTWFGVLSRHEAQEPEYQIKLEAETQISAERALALLVLMEHDKNRTISERDIYVRYKEPLAALRDEVVRFAAKFDNVKEESEQALAGSSLDSAGNAIFARSLEKFDLIRSSLTLQRYRQIHPKENVEFVFHDADLARVRRVHALLVVLHLLKTGSSFGSVLDQHEYNPHLEKIAEMVRYILERQAKNEMNSFLGMIQIQSNFAASVTIKNNEDLPSIPTPDRNIKAEKADANTICENRIKEQEELLERNSTPNDAGDLFENMEVAEQQGAEQGDAAGVMPDDAFVAENDAQRQAPIGSYSKLERRESLRVRGVPPPPDSDDITENCIDYASPEMAVILAHFYKKFEAKNKAKPYQLTMNFTWRPNKKETVDICGSTGYELKKVNRLLLECKSRCHEAVFVQKVYGPEMRSEMERYFSPKFFAEMELHLDSFNQSLNQEPSDDEPSNDEPSTSSANVPPVARRGRKRKSEMISGDDADAPGPSKRRSVLSIRGRPRKQ